MEISYFAAASQKLKIKLYANNCDSLSAVDVYPKKLLDSLDISFDKVYVNCKFENLVSNHHIFIACLQLKQMKDNLKSFCKWFSTHNKTFQIQLQDCMFEQKHFRKK